MPQQKPNNKQQQSKQQTEQKQQSNEQKPKTPFDPHRFSWKEATASESSGKTSAILIICLLASFVVAALLIALVTLLSLKLIEASVTLSLIETILSYYYMPTMGLLGVRSISSSLGSGQKVSISNVTNSDGSRMRSKTITRREPGFYGTADSSVIDTAIEEEITEDEP